MGDYIIGACLFLLGTFLLFYVVRRVSESPGQIKPATVIPAPVGGSAMGRPFYVRFAAMLALVLFSCYGVARAYVLTHTGSYAAQTKADENAPGQFPDRIGSYTLSRTWNENIFGGPLVFHWAQYVPADGGTPISLGVSPVLGSHDTLICHSASGRRSTLARPDHTADCG